jgi:glutamate synthase (NADPH/NADH) small chain
MQLGSPDVSGRRRPEAIPGSEFVLPADTAIVAIGQQPRRDLLSWIDGVELTGGRVRVDAETGRTKNPKYFAAGDAVSGGATVVQAVRQAKVAARAIDAELRSAT